MIALRVLVLAIGSFVGANVRADGRLPIPSECRTYSWVPADARDDTFAWNQLLSLGTCLQDSTTLRITAPGQLEIAVEELTNALEVPMMIYASALEYGPRTVKLRAAYQVGMAHVSLIVRARTSIVAPPDVATNPDAARRYHELHAQLEPLLARSLAIALVSFTMIDQAAERDPTIAADPVTGNMVRSARAMLEVLSKPAAEEPSGEHLQT